MEKLPPPKQDEIERKGSILVDYKDLLVNKQISIALPDLARELKDMPEKILDCLGLAIHQVHAWSLSLAHCCIQNLWLYKNLFRKGLLFNLDDEINPSLLCFSLQVLTKDLEKHADELQAQEGLPAGATPIINIPHINARCWFFYIICAEKH